MKEFYHGCVIKDNKYIDFVLVLIAEDGSETVQNYELQEGETIVEALPPTGFLKPEWNGSEWVETASDEEIAEKQSEEEEAKAAIIPTPQEDADAMLVDLDFRVTMLELGLL